MEHQQAIIQHGIDSGALTHHDARFLLREQEEIRETADDLRRREVSRDERYRILDVKLDRAEHHIRELMHQDRDRRDGYPREDDRSNHDRWGGSNDDPHHEDRPDHSGDEGDSHRSSWGH